MSDVNIPLLRKAVEWAEAEAAKPPELCEWEQNYYGLSPAEHQQSLVFRPGTGQEIQKAPECGTCYCIAGFVAQSVGEHPGPREARVALGLSIGDASALFHYGNTIEDVRRIAEEIAGERL